MIVDDTTFLNMIPHFFPSIYKHYNDFIILVKDRNRQVNRVRFLQRSMFVGMNEMVV
ncbi:hypothetical protein BDF14DRAFT_1775308 [Spinellus fusiger]|nr:hypothetical protein BDF14DRAFT_1775308 [Spinellus fusiger]